MTASIVRFSRTRKAHAARKVVAVVDDDESLRRSVGNLLGSLGIDVETFASAESFLGSPTFDETRCLVVDLRMGGMSGLELMARLATMGQAIPVIMLTAHGDPAVRQLAINAGAIAFLTKPFGADDLIAALEPLVGAAHP